MLATMMRDLLARSRAGKAGSCVPIPQARDQVSHYEMFLSHDIRAHHLPSPTIAVLTLLHILVHEPRPRQGELSLLPSLLSASPLPCRCVSRSVSIQFQPFYFSTSRLVDKLWKTAHASPRSKDAMRSRRALHPPPRPLRWPTAAARAHRFHPPPLRCPRLTFCGCVNKVSDPCSAFHTVSESINDSIAFAASRSLARSAEAAAFFAHNAKADASPKAPSPFSVLVSASIKGPDQKIFRHHDSTLSAEDIILLFDLLAGQCHISTMAGQHATEFAQNSRTQRRRAALPRATHCQTHA